MSNDDIPDWERKYWAQRAATVQQQRSNPPPQSPQAVMNPRTPYGGSEINAADIFAQKLLGGQVGGSSDNSPVVFLREGVTYYRQIPNPDGFGTTMPLIRSMGPLTQVTGKQFEMKGEVTGYCVDSLPHVDLSKVNENPQRMMALVKVQAPFVGAILVPRSAVIETTYGNGGQQLLKG